MPNGSADGDPSGYGPLSVHDLKRVNQTLVG